MSYVNYLDGYIYHMVHFDNLRNIFQRRAILSKEKVLHENIPYQSIAEKEVQTLRDRIFIRDPSEQRYCPLHSYVPFYFATRTPMLYVQYKKGVQDEIIIFAVDRSLLKNQRALFTNGNASNQQLSKFREEKVGITPATFGTECLRKYYPGGPYGTNANRTDFYSDLSFLDRHDWDCINNNYRIDPPEEHIRVRHAEVLVPDLLPLGQIRGIFVRTRDMVQAVNALIEESSLTGRIPAALRRISLYF